MCQEMLIQVRRAFVSSASAFGGLWRRVKKTSQRLWETPEMWFQVSADFSDVRDLEASSL